MLEFFCVKQINVEVLNDEDDTIINVNIWFIIHTLIQ